jgi:MFS family permease
LRSLPEVLRRDRNFRMYLLAQIIFSLSGMATGFLANLFFGFLADRKGYKLSLEICWLLSALALVLAIIAPNPLWFFPIFFLSGAVSAGTFISGISIVYEFTDAENRTTYIGLANTIPGVIVAITSLIGGWLAGARGYRSMFILSAIIGAVSWVLLRYAVREPRQMKSSTSVIVG